MIRKFLAFILMFALVMSFGTAHADSVPYIDADRKVSRSTRTTASPFTASQQTLERSRLTALLCTLQVSVALN